MRVFMTRSFGRCARKERLEAVSLCGSIDRAERGLIDADLGGHVIKQRVARPGRGRSSGYRTLIAFRSAERAVFLHGFAKNDQDDISEAELRELRKVAVEVLGWSEDDVSKLLANGKWTELERDA